MSEAPFVYVRALECYNQLWPISKSGFDSPVIDVRIPDSVITSVVEYSATLAYVSTDKGQIFEVNVKTQQVSPILSIATEVSPLSPSPVVDSQHGSILQQPLLLHRLRPSVPSDATHQASKNSRFPTRRRRPCSPCRSRSLSTFPTPPPRFSTGFSATAAIMC